MDYEDADYNDNFNRLAEPEREALQRLAAQPGWQISPNTAQSSKLKRLDVAAIIINRMVGTGIFETPSAVIKKTHSIGGSLLFWLLGCFASLCGSIVFVEYGLTIPRGLSRQSGRRVCLPCNGGELNYIQYLLENFDFFPAFLFGTPFIIIGNSAANAIAFAHSTLELANVRSRSELVLGIAVSAVGAACILHGSFRSIGIRINNLFAITKLLFLFVILFAGLIFSATKKFRPSATSMFADHDCSINATAVDSNDNFYSSFNPLGGVRSTGVDVATAYLQIIFTFGGFNQANYILSDIREPGTKFKSTSFATVITVCITYMLVNVAYLGIVPIKQFYTAAGMENCKENWNIASEFFQLTMGSRKVYSTFLMISSLGNIVVTTFTAARVKQEIAKTGIIPFATFFGNNYNVPAILKKRILRRPNGGSTTHRTPAAAMLLHFVFSVALIAAVYHILEDRTDAYVTLISIYSYVVDAFFAACLGAGILYLRLCRVPHQGEHWSDISTIRSAPISIIAGIVTLVVNTFPLIVVFVGFAQSSKTEARQFKTTAGGSLGLLGLSVLLWLLFRTFWARNRTLRVDREPVVWVNSAGEEERAFDNFRIQWEDPSAGWPGGHANPIADENEMNEGLRWREPHADESN